MLNTAIVQTAKLIAPIWATLWPIKRANRKR